MNLLCFYCSVSVNTFRSVGYFIFSDDSLYSKDVVKSSLEIIKECFILNQTVSVTFFSSTFYDQIRMIK